jgi:ribosomal protein S18 acetylase RimI-like enzyme
VPWKTEAEAIREARSTSALCPARWRSLHRASELRRRRQRTLNAVLELAERSIMGFAETLACLGRTGVGGAQELRTPGVVGARVPWATDNHWIDAAVADADADLVEPPHCVWSTAVAQGRQELTEIAMPCMGLVLGSWPAPDAATLETPSLAIVGELNDRAYGQRDRLGPLISSIVDSRVRTHGLRVDGEWACVALTLRLADDVSVQYVATEARFRRRGLAAQVVGGALLEARSDGLRTATLQASPDGRGVYERLGFRTVTTLRASRAR